MELFIRKYTIPVFWSLILLDCIFLYFDLPYIVFTEPLLIPLLILYLFLRDDNIGRPTGKFIFYIGLFFSFFGDVLQLVVTNGVFFFNSLVSFMIMNLCYGISFLSLNRTKIKHPFLLLIALAVFIAMGFLYTGMMGNDLGEFEMPIIFYIGTLIWLAAMVVNLAGNPQYSVIVYRYFIPATVILIIQNIAFTVNLFRYNGHPAGFVFSIIGYGLFQYLMVRGILKAYQI